MKRHHLGALLCGVVLIAGCSASVASLASTLPSPSTSGAASAVIPAPTPSLMATSTPRPTASQVAAQKPNGVTVDAVAVTVVDGLRVRSKPSVTDDSFKYSPLLPLGTQLYVLNGPISASGYGWYEVVALASRTLPQGWVAAGSLTGEPWLVPVEFKCPPVPTDFRTLAAFPPAVGLACFPRIPIKVTARLIGCNCDVDGGWLTPDWFSLGTGTGEMLVEPSSTRPPANVADWFWLSLDPAGQHPKVLPLGEVVDVTGVFDHPGAARCTFTDIGGEPVASQRCRLAFGVTKLATRP
jgi:hypothetical protein